MQAIPVNQGTKLPRAVVERSARIAQHLAAQSEGADPQKTVEAPPPAGNPDVQATQQPTPTPAPTPQSRQNDPAYWEQRFHTVQGLLTAVKNERIADRAAWELERVKYESRIAELTAAAATTAAPPEADPTAFFTAEQIEKYGEEQCRAMATAALRAAQQTATAALEAQMKPVREQAERDASARSRDLMDAFLDRLVLLVPDYAAFDDRDDWKAWLAEADEKTGEVRQVALTRHIKAHNEVKTAAMFSEFRASLEAPPAPPVAPSTTGPGSTPTPPPAPTGGQGYPSKAEIKEHYKRAALNQLTDADRVAFENRLKLPQPS